MDNNQLSTQQGYLYKQDYETAQIADYLESYPWDEVLKRADLFNRVLNEGDFTPANLIRARRNFLLEDLVQDIRKIPEQYYSATLFRFIKADLADNGKAFEAQLKEFWPEAALKPNLNLPELQGRAKKIANGLDNLYRIALYRKAQSDLNTISVLKNKSPQELKQLSEKLKSVDAAVAEKIKAKQPIDKKIGGLAEIMQASGRTNLEIDDIFADTNNYVIKTKVIGIIQTMLESIAAIEQARKDNSSDKLAAAEGLTEVFSHLFADEIDRFYKEITAREPSFSSMATNSPEMPSTPPPNPPPA